MKKFNEVHCNIGHGILNPTIKIIIFIGNCKLFVLPIGTLNKALKQYLEHDKRRRRTIILHADDARFTYANLRRVVEGQKADCCVCIDVCLYRVLRACESIQQQQHALWGRGKGWWEGHMLHAHATAPSRHPLSSVSRNANFTNACWLVAIETR